MPPWYGAPASVPSRSLTTIGTPRNGPSGRSPLGRGARPLEQRMDHRVQVVVQLLDARDRGVDELDRLTRRRCGRARPGRWRRDSRDRSSTVLGCASGPGAPLDRSPTGFRSRLRRIVDRFVPAPQVDGPPVDRRSRRVPDRRRGASRRGTRSSGRRARGARARGRRRAPAACGANVTCSSEQKITSASSIVGIAVVHAERLQPAVGDRPLRVRVDHGRDDRRARARTGSRAWRTSVSISAYEPAWISVATVLRS